MPVFHCLVDFEPRCCDYSIAALRSLVAIANGGSVSEIYKMCLNGT